MYDPSLLVTVLPTRTPCAFRRMTLTPPIPGSPLSSESLFSSQKTRPASDAVPGSTIPASTSDVVRPVWTVTGAVLPLPAAPMDTTSLSTVSSP